MFSRLFKKPLDENPLDQAILKHGDHEEVDKIYQARWVWYHTILAAEIAFTNILLLAILFAVLVK